MKSGDSQNFSLIDIVWKTRKKDSNSLGTHICDVECQKVERRNGMEMSKAEVLFERSN